MSSIASTHSTSAAAAKTNHGRTLFLVMAAIALLIAGYGFVRQWRAKQEMTPVMAAAPIDASLLLPLAAPVNPLTGGHDLRGLPDFYHTRSRTLAASVPQPNIELPVPRWEWGTISIAPPVAQVIPIHNRGSEPLLISKLTTNCNCATATLSSSVIPPGQRADLKVVFDPKFHGILGTVALMVWLESNDPDLPLAEIQLAANVVP